MTDASALKASREAFEKCAAEARRYASHYSEASDGRNTFIMLAEWAERQSIALPPPDTDRSGFPEGWDRDDTKEGMFRTHRCTRCNDGAKPCPDGQTGPSRNCEHPHARTD